VLIGVPGAFTPTCDKTHLPGYIANFEQIKAKGYEVSPTCEAEKGGARSSSLPSWLTPGRLTSQHNTTQHNTTQHNTTQQTIACVSVNDAFVMDAWGKASGAEGKVRMLADYKGWLPRAGSGQTVRWLLSLWSAS
jgi:2-Cys peroxiredoxin 5